MPATTESTSQYHLNLQPQKENVFVTQLNERSTNDDIRRFPIVKDSADKLLQSGIHTLQSTSLLRQAVEVEHVDRDLAEKREEFRQRMEVCKEKEEALKVKQEKIKNRVTKFDRFLKENEAKRLRALRKYQHELKANKMKAKELDRLNLELENLKRHRKALIDRLQRNKIYEAYMTSVIDVLPEDYLEMSADSMIQSIIQRHEGLSATNSSLVERNGMILSTTEEGQRELDDLRQEINKQKLVFNSELVNLQKQQESLTRKNKLLEIAATNSLEKKRNVLSELGQLLLAIDNLAHQSHRRHWPAMGSMSYTQKLSMLEEYFLEREGVLKLVEKMIAESDHGSVTAAWGHSLGGSKYTGSVGNTKSVAGASPTVERALPQKHSILPPITKSTGKMPVPSTGIHANRDKSTRSGVSSILERLTAISESNAEE